MYSTAAEGTYILKSHFLAWSPDDKTIGFTLVKPFNAWEAEQIIAQLDWQAQTVTFISENNAIFGDWSADNRIVAWRDGNQILDVSSGVWAPLTDPVTGRVRGGFAHWSSDGTIVLGIPSSWRWLSATITIADPQADEWETVMVGEQPVQMSCYATFPCIPVPSPDGRWIAWIEAEPRRHIWKIMLYDRLRSEIVKVADSRDYDFGSWQALIWAPDSRQLAFSISYEYKGVLHILHLYAVD